MKNLLILIAALGLALGALQAQTADPPAGSGTQADPYQIATLNNLYWLTQNSSSWASYFIQTGDIDASSTTGWDGGNGFPTIGTSSTNFTGSYDGQGHTIDGLYINRSQSYQGMFGGTSDSAKISNVNLTSVSIAGGFYTGGLVGFARNGTEITNCSCSGDISSYFGYAGGIVGILSNSAVYTSYSTGTVSCSGDHAGGLVGYAYWGSTTGITGVFNSYSLAAVSCNNNGGGLIGTTSGDFAGPPVRYCYSTGTVSGTSNIGGLAGSAQSPFENCFWDTESSGLAISAAGTGKTTQEMKTLSTFTDLATAGLDNPWDFVGHFNNDTGDNDYWDMDQAGGINQGYPYLSWQDGADQSLPVELVSFTAVSGDGYITLHWATESELNNDVFLIERGRDGQHFTLLAEVPGQGTKSSRTDYSFTDNQVFNGTTYFYRLADRSLSGKITYHSVISATAGIRMQVQDNAPRAFALLPNYPNPFNPKTTIQFDVPSGEAGGIYIVLSVYNSAGQRVKTLFQGRASAGRYTMEWDGKNEFNQPQASGLYVLRLVSERFSANRKMILLR